MGSGWNAWKMWKMRKSHYHFRPNGRTTDTSSSWKPDYVITCQWIWASGPYGRMESWNASLKLRRHIQRSDNEGQGSVHCHERVPKMELVIATCTSLLSMEWRRRLLWEMPFVYDLAITTINVIRIGRTTPEVSVCGMRMRVRKPAMMGVSPNRGRGNKITTGVERLWTKLTDFTEWEQEEERKFR